VELLIFGVLLAIGLVCLPALFAWITFAAQRDFSRRVREHDRWERHTGAPGNSVATRDDVRAP
jgi:hypothetical protein